MFGSHGRINQLFKYCSVSILSINEQLIVFSGHTLLLRFLKKLSRITIR